MGADVNEDTFMTNHSPRDTWSHPLITTLDRKIDRRELIKLSAAVGVAGGMAPSTYAASGQSDPESDPDIDVTGDEDAVALLEEAAQAMADLDSFHFEISTVQGETVLLGAVTLNSITGDIRRPTDFQTTIEASLAQMGSLTITAVSVDNTIWVQNPLDPEGGWQSIAGLEEVLAFVNPDILILSGVRYIDDAEIDGTETLRGQETTVVRGTVNFGAIAGPAVGTPASEEESSPEGATEQLIPSLRDEPRELWLWITDDGHLLELEIVGPILDTEAEDVVRVIQFSNFNEPVDITAPE